MIYIILGPVNFEDYLYSKKIDSLAFRNGEQDLWGSWKVEFEQVHPSSFTAQKLYLINPLRRKYPLKADSAPPKAEVTPVAVDIASKGVGEPESKPEVDQKPKAVAKPVAPKPVFRPKPKMN